MPVLYHTECFQTASALFGGSPQRLKRIDSCLEHNLIVINDKHVDGIKSHLFTLPLCYRDIQNDRKCCSLAHLALTFDSTAHKVHHLLGNGKTESGPSYAVDTAVYLA